MTTSIVKLSPGDTDRKGAVLDADTQLPKQVAGSVREKLYLMQKGIAELPHVDCKLQHVFAPGVYARTIFIPRNTVMVGKIHRHAHINILSQGIVSVLTESGGVERFIGPLTMVSDPGTKRGLYAHSDVVWTTIHLTKSTDLDVIENEVIAKSYEDFLNGGG